MENPIKYFIDFKNKLNDYEEDLNLELNEREFRNVLINLLQDSSVLYIIKISEK